MFERFTDRARRVVVLAQQEARLLDHNYIGTEHLLLGLIHEEGVAASALEALGIRLEAVRAEVEEIIGRGSDPPGGHIPFTPRAKRVLELSLRESLDLGHGHIGTEHILLGLIREGEGVAAQVLVKLGADLSRARLQVLQVLATTAEAPPEQVATVRRVPAAPVMVPGSPPGLAEQPVELVRVLPLDRELVRRHGYRLQLISLEVWSGWLDLRYALLPEEPPAAPPMREVVLGWRLTDDAGTSYELGGAASSGGRLLRILQLSFQPAPPATARTLTLTVQDEQGADLATAEIPLAGAS